MNPDGGSDVNSRESPLMHITFRLNFAMGGLQILTGANTLDITQTHRLVSHMAQLFRLREQLENLHAADAMLLERGLQLSLQESGPKGPPPVSDMDWNNLKRVVVSKYHLQMNMHEDCAVCRDPLQDGMNVVQLPCGHMFCPDCIESWLRQHRTCPCCRGEVVNVPKPYDLEACGFTQTPCKSCQLSPTEKLMVLPRCSHAFHHTCLFKYILKSSVDKAISSKIAINCPLCNDSNMIFLSDVTSEIEARCPDPSASRPTEKGHRGYPVVLNPIRSAGSISPSPPLTPKSSVAPRGSSSSSSSSGSLLADSGNKSLTGSFASNRRPRRTSRQVSSASASSSSAAPPTLPPPSRRSQRSLLGDHGA